MRDRILKAFDYVERAKARALFDMLELGGKVKTSLPIAAAPIRGAVEIQQALPPKSALIEYYLSDDLLLIFAITNDALELAYMEKPKVKELLKVLDEFEKRIDLVELYAQGHEDLQTVSNADAMAGIAAALYKYLLQPVQLDWGKLERLFIVPHGQLYGLPFCTLHHEGEFFIERVPITQIPSASIWYYLLVERRSVSSEQRYSYFGIANPRPREFSCAWQLDPALQQDISECEKIVKNVAKLFEKERLSTCILLREKATYALFKEYLKDYTIVDLQTHAYYDPGQPMRSVFVLVGERGEPRWVTAEEILDLQLHPEFRLLVLGTCYGGKVRVTPGNDLLGFIRAFMAIGARSILSYRWALLDALPTVECLINFYTSWIQGGNPKDRALQDAQKNLIEKGRKGEGLEQGWPTFDHPYYWAWTLIGDPL